MKRPVPHLLGLLTILALIAGSFGFGAMQEILAQTGNDDVDLINDTISEKKARIDQLNRKIEQYREQIEAKQKESNSLLGDIALLENRITKAELDVESLNLEIETVNEELRLIDEQIAQLEKQLNLHRGALAEILRNIDEYDRVMGLQVVFGTESFSDLFDHMQYLENVNEDLSDQLQQAQQARKFVLASRTRQEAKRGKLQDLQLALEREKGKLEEERVAKDVLLSETQQSELQFHSLLSELRQEQSYINHQVAELQGKIEEKLREQDGPGMVLSTLSWPADRGYRGISTYFHDPTYPFRHLFEHSGLDIPQRQGTPITSAGPGYVAFTRTGRSYGNYVMVIHTNGLATLYAHLSKISVKPDQFVSRGEVIGLSGGAPGTQGAGLSTGPHLHFEVRKNGIPVDPLGYLSD